MTTPELQLELLLEAYCRGWFPMVDPRDGAVEWFSPDPRAILPLDRFHVPGSLGRVVRAARFDVRADSAFEHVMRACAASRSEDDLTWLDDRMIEAYVELHRAGHAHSIEAWRDGRLVGGLYGVSIGGAFFGESMFSLPTLGGTDASKVCLVHLVNWLNQRGFTLLDTQWSTEHLERFGVIEISRHAYLRLLADAVALDIDFGSFRAAPADGG